MNAALKIAGWILIAAMGLLAVLYGGDYIVAKYRVSANSSGALEAVKIQPMYVIPHKDSRAEYVFGDPQVVTCLHSIFSHFGHDPCWYVKKNTQPSVQMTILPSL